MVFSSTIFLFLFLPIVFIGYFLMQDRLKNYFLLLASLFFYTWGEPVYILLMIASITGNYLAGLLMKTKYKKQFFTLGIVLNLLGLFWFKYSNFMFDQFARVNIISPDFQRVALPIGISFYTFQAMSYLIDLYRGTVKVQKSWYKLALYISLFPQLIAGPIVRYETVAEEIDQRRYHIDDVHQGLCRFVFGLSKKVIISNNVAVVADAIFNLSPSEWSFSVSWIGILCYTIQIYFDFSGYSDMAIGLGKIFGFHFNENFNYPYIARNIQDFWRRWHISLSSWFRDYLYIPLGGNRKGNARTYFNLLTVFTLCGLWHGASWNFLAWGLYHGLFLCLERMEAVKKCLAKLPRALQHLYTMLVVCGGWVLFRAETLTDAGVYLRGMFGLNGTNSHYYAFEYFSNEAILIFFLSFIAATPLTRKFAAIKHSSFYKSLAALALLFFCILSISSGTYNPFIYFRF